MSEIAEKIVEKLTGLNEKIDQVLAAVDPRPASYKLYKGARGNNGAIQFDLAPIHRSSRDLGAMFLQAAPAVGHNNYDWDQKIMMALNLADIAHILDMLRAPPGPGQDGVDIYHDKHKGTNQEGQVVTTLKISRGKEYGWYFRLGRQERGEHRSVGIPVSDGELIEIKYLLQRALVRILGW